MFQLSITYRIMVLTLHTLWVPGLNLDTFKLTLNKWQLDDAHKDKQHKLYHQDFKVRFSLAFMVFRPHLEKKNENL